MLHIGQLRIEETAQPLQLVRIAQVLGADDLVELPRIDLVIRPGLQFRRRLVVEIGLAGLTVGDLVGRGFGRHLRVALHLGIVFLALLGLHLARGLVLGLFRRRLVVAAVVLVFRLVLGILAAVTGIVALVTLLVLGVLAVVLHFQVGDHLARQAGKRLLVMDIGKQVAQALAGLVLDIAAEKADDARNQAGRRIAGQSLARHLAQHVGKPDLFLRFLAAETAALQIGDIGGLQVLAHALQGPGADGFQARLFERVEGIGAAVVARAGAGVDGVVVVADTQRHAVGDATDLLRLLGGEVARRMRQDQLVAFDLGPIGAKDDLELRRFGQGARRMGQGLLERLAENGGFLGHRPRSLSPSTPIP